MSRFASIVLSNEFTRNRCRYGFKWLSRRETVLFSQPFRSSILSYNK